MPRPEFSQLYKFVSWIGLVLILAAVGLPVLVAQLDPSLLVTKSQLKDLTPEASGIIQQRQNATILAQQLWPFASALLGLVGLSVLIWSLRTWNRRQGVQDEIEELNRQKLRNEVQAQTVDEVKERAEKVATEGARDQGRDALSASTVLRIESKVFARLNEALVPEYVGQPNRKVRRGAQTVYLDAVFQPLDDQHDDIIVDIKYLSRTTGVLMRIRDTVLRVANACTVYAGVSGRRSIGLVVVVLAAGVDEMHGKSSVEAQFREAASNIVERVVALVLNEEELESWRGSDLRDRLSILSIMPDVFNHAGSVEGLQ